jgi:predicted permease
MEIFFRLFLYVLLFVVGAISIKQKWLNRTIANKFLSWLFYFGLPIAVFYAITSTPFDAGQMILPVIASIISAVSGILLIIIGIIWKIPKKILGVLVASAMIMNTSLSLPFFSVFYGAPGLATMSLFDLGNLLMIFTVVYFVTLRIGGMKLSGISMIEKILKMPIIWVIVASLLLTMSGFKLPSSVEFVLSWSTFFIFLWVMFTLGLLFEPKFTHLRYILLGLFMRYVVGFTLGYIIVQSLGLTGLERLAVLIGASSPNGYTSLVYAKIAKLDTHFASQLVSISLGMGIIVVPLMLFFLK